MAASAPAATLRVPSEYATIQAAVDASVSGDSVLIDRYFRIYHE